MLIARAEDLDPGAVLRIARAGAVPVLAPELLAGDTLPEIPRGSTGVAGAAEACRAALDGAREVLACELLAVHQARCLGATLPPDAGAFLVAMLAAVAEVLPATAVDRPFGRDVELLLGLAWKDADRRP